MQLKPNLRYLLGGTALLLAASVPLVALADKKPTSMKQSVTMLQASIQSFLEAREARKKVRHQEEDEKDEKRAALKGPSQEEGFKEDEEEEGLDYLLARLYWLQVRAYPEDEWDWSRMDAAVAHKKKMPSVVYRTVNGGGGGGAAARAGNGSQVPILPEGATWEFVGPRNWDSGTITGRINGVAIDPVNPRISYVASAGGGVWKTLDAGVNWTPLTDQKLDRLHTTCVAINPRNVRQILVGLGDHHGQGNPGRGIARSTDGGNTWSLVGPGMAGSNVSAIVFDPDINNLVMASSTAGIFRSTNGGVTWTRVKGADINTDLPGGDYTSLTVAARNNSTGNRRYYAANRNQSASAGLYRSDDRGQTWNRLNGAPLRFVNVPGLTLTGIEVAASPVNPDSVYFSEGEANAEDGRIWRSLNAGADFSWVDITGTLIGDGDWYQVWYDHYLASSSRVTGSGAFDVLYSGLFPAQASASGDSNWVRYNPGHVDQQGVTFNPRSVDQGIIVNDGGAYSTLFSGGATGSVSVTASLNANLGVTQFYHADWHPTNPDIMLGGTQDNSTALSQGNLFNWLRKIGGDGMSVGIVDENANVMYGTTQEVGTVARSTNGGTTFGSIFPSAPDYPDGFGGDVKPWKTILFASPRLESPIFANQTAADPRTAPVAFVATDRLWRHGIPDKDMDTSLWTERLGSTVLTNGTQGAFVTCVQAVVTTRDHPNLPPGAFPNTSASTVYVGSSDGSVWMTQNAIRTGKLDANNVPVWAASQTGDVTWQKLNAPPVGTQLPAGAVMSISVNPADPFDVLVGIGGGGQPHLWRCANTRSAWATPQAPWVWTPQSGFQGPDQDNNPTTLPDAVIVGITRDPQDPQNTYYVATDFGVFGTVNGGSTWCDIGKAYGLPNAEVTTIEAVAATGYLNIATFGRGMWRIPLADKSGFELAVNAGVVRSGANLNATVTVENFSPVNATNVRITQASMRTERTNINVNTNTALPLPLAASLFSGDPAVNGVVRFNNPNLSAGTFVNLKVTVQATVNGQTRTIVQTFRLRLP